MKKYWLLPFFLLLFSTIASAQKIQYSRGSIKTPGKGYVRLIANVKGLHHLIYFPPQSKPVISVFDEQLQLQAKTEIDLNIPQDCDIKLIQFKDYYFLYAHPNYSTKHLLIKIFSNGSQADVSSIINSPADSAWNRSTTPLQLFNINDSLFVVTTTYFSLLKKIKTIIAKVNPWSSSTVVASAIFPIDLESEFLKEMTLYENNLFILKTGKDKQYNNILTLTKFELSSGFSYTKQFESGKYVFLKPAVRYNKADSSAFIYSPLIAPLGYSGKGSSLFMVALNSKLKETTPIQILPNVLRTSMAAYFLVEKSKSNGWICFSINQSDRDNNNDLDFYIRINGYPNAYNTTAYYLNSINSSFVTPGQNFPTAVLITVLNNQLEKTTDSITDNKGRYYKLQPSPYANFIYKGTPYLLLVQGHSKKAKGLVLISPNNNNELETVSLRVYDKYNFALPLLQTAENYFIVPFTDGKEMGLMKITLNN